MATLEQIQSFVGRYGEPELLPRFRAARLQCAWDILEDIASPPAHLDWAKKILKDYNADDGYEYRWCLCHESIQDGSAIDDAILVAAVASFIDDWSAEPAASLAGTFGVTGPTGAAYRAKRR